MNKYIIKIGNTQHLVEFGKCISINLKTIEDSKKYVAFYNTMGAESTSSTVLGNPFLKNVRVFAKIESKRKFQKSLSIKFKPKKGFRRFIGHRTHKYILKIL